MIATLAGERELAAVVLQAFAGIAGVAVTRDAWRWLQRRRSEIAHPARHRPASGPGQPSHVHPLTTRVHDWAQSEEETQP